MQSLKLDIQNAKQLNAMGTEPQIPEQEEFLFVSTIKLEKRCEKTQYPSNLYIFQILPEGIQLMGKYPQKRIIGGIKNYRGRLLTVQQGVPAPELQIVTQAIIYNTNTADLQEQQKNDICARYVIDKSLS